MISQEDIEIAKAQYAKDGSWAKAAKSLGITKSAMQRRLAKSPALKDERDITNNNQTITGVWPGIKTLEQALVKAEVNLDEWEVERHVINKWDMGYKTPEGVAKAQELWQIKIWLRRRKPLVTDDAIDTLISKIGNWKPVNPTFASIPSQDKHLLEVSLFDAHFGKLAWDRETNSEYNLKVANTLYQNAVEDLLDKVKGFNIEQILFPIGNDFFHVNSWKNTTVNDTPQDVDNRMSKIFDIGCEAVIRGIEYCLQVAPVNLIWVPGNHDPETSLYMAKIIDAWYRNVDAVRVNSEPTCRKYVGYGVNLLGFTHGNEEPHRDLPTLMATEKPDLWATSTNRVWHLGHFHKKKETSFNAGDTFGGVRVQVLPSLSGTDQWHFKKGYVKGHQAAEAWLWNFKEGYAGHFNANARQ